MIGEYGINQWGNIMPKKKKIKHPKEKEETSIQITENANPNVQKKIVEISTGGVIGIIVTIALAAIAGVWTISEKFSDLQRNISIAQNDIAFMKNDISDLQHDVSNLKNDVSDLKNNISNINNYLYGDNGVEKQIDKINEILSISAIFVSDDVKQYIEQASISKNDVDSVGFPIKSDTMIGTDIDGNNYVANNLINQTVLLTYTEYDKEVYFIGQYSEDYKWTGYCVTNAYNLDGTLYSICESNFDNGKRKDFKSIMHVDNDLDWLYSEREITKKEDNETTNIGKNIRYIFEYDDVKNFTMSNARVSDIMHVDALLGSVTYKISEFYSGDTSNELYNDESGQAYRIKYTPYGNIENLYVGRFKDGDFCDFTGNAWEIVYSNDENTYFYNKGIFEKNHYIGDEYVPVNLNKIKEIISDYDFDCNLKWKEN